MARHVESCSIADTLVRSADPTPAVVSTTTTNSEPLSARYECAYCSKRGFRSEAELTQHVSVACIIAKSFARPVATLAQRDQPSSSNSTIQPDSASSVRTFVQGRLRRKGDASALHKATVSLLSDLDQKYNNNNNESDNNSRTCSNNGKDEEDNIGAEQPSMARVGSTTSARTGASSTRSLPTKMRVTPVERSSPSTSTRSKTLSSGNNINSNSNSSRSQSAAAVAETQPDALALSISSLSSLCSHHQVRSSVPLASAGVHPRVRKVQRPVPRTLKKLELS